MKQNILEKNLKLLGLSDNEAIVYLCLTGLGESSVINISKKSGLPRTTIKSILDRLVEEGYVTIQKYNNKNNYWIESPDILKKKLEAKIELTENLNYLLKDLYHSNSDIPFSQVYDTKQSIANFIEKTVLSLKKNCTIKIIESPKDKNYDVFFTAEYFEKLISIKKKKSILTKTLIQYDSFDCIKKLILQKQNIIIKEMNENINFEASIWIIEEKIILFSGKIPFIVEINNRVIANSFRSIFDFLWSISKIKYEV